MVVVDIDKTKNKVYTVSEYDAGASALSLEELDRNPWEANYFKLHIEPQIDSDYCF